MASDNICSRSSWLITNISAWIRKIKATTSKDNSTGLNSPVSREVSNMAVESLASSLTATKQPTSPAKTTHHKKIESAQDCKAQKATKSATRQAAKTRTVKTLLEVVNGLPRSQVTVSTGSTVIDCANGVVSSGTLELVQVYNAKGNEVAMIYHHCLSQWISQEENGEDVP